MALAAVRFNVGGKLYQVSRTLLDQHPLTMLARSASKQWQTDPESEIFVERDGDRFAYVLDYLRDGRAFLPLVVSKEAFLTDLAYYGLEDVDESKIERKLADVAATRLHVDQLAKSEIVVWKHDAIPVELAILCAKAYFEKGLLQFLVTKNEAKGLFDHSWEETADLTRCNQYLGRLGLKLSRLPCFNYGNYSETMVYLKLTDN